MALDEYRTGEYGFILHAPFAICQEATKQTARNFRMTIQEWRTDNQTANIVLRNARGDVFKIQLAVLAQGQTMLYVRAGLWGDDLASRQLAYDIGKNAQALLTRRR
jgi:hypothetical protein